MFWIKWTAYFIMVSMLSGQEQKALQDFKKRVLKEFGDQVLHFRLFGSRARGEGNEESDVDILVLMKEAPTKIRGRVFEIAADILLNYEIDISPLVMSQKQFEEMKSRERLLPMEIEKEGIPI